MKKRLEILAERKRLESQMTPLEREHCRVLGFVERAAMLARVQEAVESLIECDICLDGEEELMVCTEILADKRAAENTLVKEALTLEILDGISA